MGTQRSGTTLLRLILDSHPHIAIGFETGFMRAVQAIKTIPDWNYGKHWYRRYGVDENDMNTRIRQFYSDFFSDYARRQGKRRWGEKTPLNLHHMEEMVDIFPSAQFVCVVRHAGGVVASLQRWRYTFDRALDYWVTANTRFTRLPDELGPDRLKLCRYEDLVLRPRATLEAVVAFLGEPWSDDLLRHHEIQAARGGPMKVEGGGRRDRPVHAGRVDAWRDELTDEQLAAVAERAAPLLASFGYDAGTAVPTPTDESGAVRSQS